jgi:hypothetical protein
VKQILSIALSALILFGNLGITFATHYCGGEAFMSQWTIGESHLSCGMEQDGVPCDYPALNKKSCCKNESFTLDVGEDFNTSVEQPNINTNFLLAFVSTYFRLNTASVLHETNTTAYLPPPRKQNRQVLFQAFRI